MFIFDSNIFTPPMIFDIQRFALHDGEGIRTLIFFKGCPLHCMWCSNPESQAFEPEVLYDEGRCRDFGECIRMAPGSISRLNGHGVEVDRRGIDQYEALRWTCPARALTISGEERSSDELLTEVLKDAPFYRHGGGVTLSGGEPLAQGEEVADLLRKLKQNRINVNMETSLHVPWSFIRRCVDGVDTFLADLKHVDQEKFRSYTGGHASLVLENLRRLTGSGAKVILRIPVIPGFNHTPGEMDEILAYAATLKTVDQVHLLPYHTYGAGKYRMLGIEYPYKTYAKVEEEELLPYLSRAQKLGLSTKIGG